MSHHINLVRIKGVANALADLKDEIAFVGGATVSLYADMPEQTDVRPTDDIDVLVEIATYSAYAKLQEKLGTLGFSVDPEAKITCRYKYQGLIVDIMPIEENVLGFKNHWYADGFRNLMTFSIEEGTDINIFKPVYFIASKLEAFSDRGGNDGRTSKDFEDIIFILDNRANIWNELTGNDEDVFDYIKETFSKLLAEKNIEEWIAAHLDQATAGQRTKKIIEGFKKITVSQ